MPADKSQKSPSKPRKKQITLLSELFLRVMFKRFITRPADYKDLALKFQDKFLTKTHPTQVLRAIQALFKTEHTPSYAAVEQHITAIHGSDETFANELHEYMKEIKDVKDDFDDVTFIAIWKEVYCRYMFMQHFLAMKKNVDFHKNVLNQDIMSEVLASTRDVSVELLHELGTGIIPSEANSDLFEKLVNDESLQPLCPFGLKPLDDATGGLRRADFAILCAKTGGGKTSMMIHIAANAVLAGVNVLYMAYEGREEDIWKDYLSYFIKRQDLDHALLQKDHAGIDALYQAGRKRGKDECGQLGTMRVLMSNDPDKLSLTGDGNIDIPNMKKIIQDYDIKVVIVDHIDKLGEKTRYPVFNKSRHEGKYCQLTTHLYDLAKEMQIAVVAGKQSNGWKNAEQGRENFHLDGATSLSYDHMCANTATIAFSINTSEEDRQNHITRIKVFKARSYEPPSPFVIQTHKGQGIYGGGYIAPDGLLRFNKPCGFYLNGLSSSLSKCQHYVDEFYDEMKENGCRYKHDFENQNTPPATPSDNTIQNNGAGTPADDAPF